MNPAETGLIAPTIADPHTPLVIRPAVTAHNPASQRTRVAIRQHELIVDEAVAKGGTDTGPTPLETLLGSLAACEAVVLRIVATAMGFAYRSLDVSCEGEADLRGARGVAGIRPHFQTVRIVLSLDTDEPDRRVAMLRRNVEARCPVLNLFAAAGVAIEITWQRSDGTIIP